MKKIDVFSSHTGFFKIDEKLMKNWWKSFPTHTTVLF